MQRPPTSARPHTLVPYWTTDQSGDHVLSRALTTGGCNGVTNQSPDGKVSPLLPVACLEDTRRRMLLQQGDEARVVTNRVPTGVAWQQGRRVRHAAVRGSEDAIEERDGDRRVRCDCTDRR